MYSYASAEWLISIETNCNRSAEKKHGAATADWSHQQEFGLNSILLKDFQGWGWGSVVWFCLY